MTTDPEVQIRDGRVRGVWRDASAAFLGIPFAAPPVGALRFAAPAAPEPWDGVLDGATMGATPQRGGDGGMTLIPEPSVPGESTLNVNVFTPAPGDPAAALPVWVYIHGGGFVSGSPAGSWYDGAAFNRDGVVTVTVSYRLGFEGFGQVPGAPANRGILDWLAALEWVRDNIAAFGGDPDAVTLAGQSAGGGAVLTLLATPRARGLFRSAWASSPVLADIPLEHADAFADEVAAIAGVPATLDGFGSVSVEDLHAAQTAATGRGAPGVGSMVALIENGYRLGPVVDGEVLPTDTLSAYAAGAGRDVALVIGANDDEFSMVSRAIDDDLAAQEAVTALGALDVAPGVAAAYAADNADLTSSDSRALLGRYISDAIFRRVAVRTLGARIAGGAERTWAYRFTWPSPTVGGACHCLDVPFLYDCLGAERVAAVAGETPPQELAEAVHGAAVRLVTEGDPGWPQWSTGAEATTRIFDDPASLEADAWRSVEALV